MCCARRLFSDVDTRPPVDIVAASGPEQLAVARVLFREYANDLLVDLRFQDFEAELAGLPGAYAEPRGALLLALVDGDWPAAARCVRWTTPTTPTPPR
jgi:hypothetical protein